VSWKLIDPNGTVFHGEITVLTQAEANYLGRGWFSWPSYMKRADKQDMNIYKLQRVGYTDILGIVAFKYNDGVFIDSLEIAPHSRRVPSHHRRYINLCDIIIAFAASYSFEHYNDGFIGLEPKTGLQSHYQTKYQAFPMSRGIFGIDTPVTKTVNWVILYIREMIIMLKRWRNNNGVRIAVRSITGDPFQGLVVQPSKLSSDEIASVMRSGRQQMIERHGAAAIHSAVLSAKEHIDRVDRSRVRV
jgi:hypothetical protein